VRRYISHGPVGASAGDGLLFFRMLVSAVSRIVCADAHEPQPRVYYSSLLRTSDPMSWELPTSKFARERQRMPKLSDQEMAEFL
jgi:hypothetical protein